MHYLKKKGFIPCYVKHIKTYNNGFEYKISEKFTLKDFEGNIFCEDADWCVLFNEYFAYKKNDEFKEVFLEDYYNNLNKNKLNISCK